MQANRVQINKPSDLPRIIANKAREKAGRRFSGVRVIRSSKSNDK